MIYIDLAIGLIVGLFLFFCCIKAYVWGLEHGKKLSEGNTPKLNLNPVKTISGSIQTHKAQKEQEQAIDELETILGYSQETALKAIKSGRG